MHYFNTSFFPPQSFLVEFPRTGAGPDEEPPRVLFDPIFSDGVGPLPWLSIRRRLPPPCTLEELPEFQFVVYSHNQCVVCLATLSSSESIHIATTTSTSLRSNEYMSCAASVSILSSR
jgi:hypothetical protein